MKTPKKHPLMGVFMGAEMGVDDRPPLKEEMAPDQVEVFERLVAQRARRGEVITVQELIDENYAKYKAMNNSKSNFH